MYLYTAHLNKKNHNGPSLSETKMSSSSRPNSLRPTSHCLKFWQADSCIAVA